jgi:hypothetical protein
MDINEQLEPVVAGLLETLKGTIEAELRGKINDEVVKAIANTEVSEIVERIISQRLEDRILEFDYEAKTKDKLNQTLAKITNNLSSSLAVTANEKIAQEITSRVTAMDIQPTIQGIVESKIGSLVQTGAFGKKSITHESINFDGFKFSGDMLKGGIIENFGSTGIDDRSSDVQMTLLDHAVAFEKSVWAPSAKIKGDIEIDGEIKGSAMDQLIKATVKDLAGNQELLEIQSNSLHQSITEKGLDLDIIKQKGQVVIDGNNLADHLTHSNLQKVGQLRELVVEGEVSLADSLYTNSKRVGVNTIEPSATFVVWDEEVEMVVKKHGKDTGYIGTPRHQRLVLGANGHTNLSIESDGSVEVENLRVGNVPMSSATAIPNYQDITGTIVWNENPANGSAVGWICLGGTKWAKFGMIE